MMSKLPANNWFLIKIFWIKYWLIFFIMVPWIIAYQIYHFSMNLLGVLIMFRKPYYLHGGDLIVLNLINLKTFFATLLFGERFMAIIYNGYLIDPGPLNCAEQLINFLKKEHIQIKGILITHPHEEHFGSIGKILEIWPVPVYGSKITKNFVNKPEKLSFARRSLMGQPVSNLNLDYRVVSEKEPLIKTDELYLKVFFSPGHCDGHLSFFSERQNLLFAGDSFMHEIFTSPNKEVNAQVWIETLNLYLVTPIETMVGTHGLILSVNPSLKHLPFVTKKKDPLKSIKAKKKFLLWAKNLVSEGEKLGLDYKVIEACLFPWSKKWSWSNFFGDEFARLISRGEFSRTHFVRSLSSHPEKVPNRFSFRN